MAEVDRRARGLAKQRAQAQRQADSLQPVASPEIGIEYGIGQIFPNVVWADILDPHGATVANRPVVSIDQLTDMRRRDGQAKALIQLVTLPLRLSLEAGSWTSPEGEEKTSPEVDFANKMWSLPPSAGGMSTPKNKVIRQMLLSLTDGFAAFEEVRKVPSVGELKGKITLKKLAYRDPRTVKFKVDKQGGFNGFKQVTTDTDGMPIDVYIPVDKAFVITQHDELNPHYGVSLFESAWPHYDAKTKLYYIAHMAAQFAAVPGRVGTVPFGAKAVDVEAFRKALAGFAFNGAMAVPDGFKVDPFNGNSGFDFIALIDHHNHMMSKSIVAPFFDQENRTVLIDSGNNSDADMFLQFMVSIANSIAENLTHYLMPRYIDWNFDSGNYPVFKPGQLSDSARNAIKDMFKSLSISATLNTTPEFVRQLEMKITEELGLDIDYDEIHTQEQKAAEAKQAADEEAAQAQNEAMKAGTVDAEGKAIPPKPTVVATPVAQAAGGGAKTPGAGPGRPSKPSTARLSAEDQEFADSAAEALLALPDDTLELSPIDEGI